jgi:hypothetical protein
VGLLDAHHRPRQSIFGEFDRDMLQLPLQNTNARAQRLDLIVVVML